MNAVKSKKLISVFLCIILCLSVTLSVSAAGINMSVFYGVPGVKIAMDQMEGRTFVDVDDRSDMVHVVESSQAQVASFYPSIMLNEEGELIFRLFGNYLAEDWKFIDEIIIKVNNTTYTFDDVEKDTSILDGTPVAILEELCIVVNWESRECLEAIKQHRYEPIWVRFSGSKGNADFILSDETKDAIVLFYDLYKAARGLTGENMSYDGHDMEVRHFAQTIEDKENIYISVYDYMYYKATNPDLEALYGNDRESYLNHFITAGMKEGRQGCKKFNVEVYKANNPDLVAIYGNDNVKYYQHFMESGRAEGRIAV